MKILKLMGALALTVILIACAQDIKKEIKIPEGWTSLSEDNYSINYPKDWDMNKSGFMGTKFVLLSPLASAQDQFRENVNLVEQDLTGRNINLDQYVEISKSQLKNFVTDGCLIESKRMTSETLDYQKIIYTGTQGVFKLKFEQYYCIVDKKVYVLTFTCEDHEFDNYKTVGEGILNSFNLKKD